MVKYLGIARGCGWQKIGAFVNLGAYYVVGIPSAILFAFVLHIGGKVNILMLIFHSEAYVRIFPFFFQIYGFWNCNAGSLVGNHVWSFRTSLVASNHYPVH